MKALKHSSKISNPGTLSRWVFSFWSDELLTQLAADSSPSGRAAASPGDVFTPASILTLADMTALLSKMTLWAFCPHEKHTEAW